MKTIEVELEDIFYEVLCDAAEHTHQTPGAFLREMLVDVIQDSVEAAQKRHGKR